MKTEEEIRKKIAEIEADARFKAEPAIVQINAPLALIQVNLGTERDILRWVLEEEENE